MKRRRKKNDVSSTIIYNDAPIDDDKVKAEVFANCFENQYVQGDNIDVNHLLDDCEPDSFDIRINEKDVRKLLESLDVNEGMGPDGISPKLLKHCAQSITKPLKTLF